MYVGGAVPQPGLYAVTAIVQAESPKYPSQTALAAGRHRIVPSEARPGEQGSLLRALSTHPAKDETVYAAPSGELIVVVVVRALIRVPLEYGAAAPLPATLRPPVLASL
jgi:hypothetical protein